MFVDAAAAVLGARVAQVALSGGRLRVTAAGASQVLTLTHVA